MAKPAKPAVPSLPAGTLRVKGPAKGRWRAGRHFGPDEQTVTADDVGEAGLAAILADPELVVVAGEDPAPAA